MEFKLRPWDMQDIESLVENANNYHIAQYMTDAFPHPYGKDDAERFIQFATKDDPVHIFAIEIGGKAVGGIGIHPQGDVHRKNAELGYWLGESYWGNKVISRAIPLMLEFAFTMYPVNRVFARPFGTNIASQRVLEKAGFMLEATLEKTFFKNDEYLDELIYAVRKK